MIPGNPDTVIGYFGFPRRRLLAAARRRLPGARLVDLDLPLGLPDAGLLPAAGCRIIANIVDNAVALGPRLRLVVAAVGEGKCDRGRHAAFLLSGMGIEVIESRFPAEEWEDRPLSWSRARGPLREKVLRIMDTVVDPSPPDPLPEPCEATHGFWGVPPNDLALLDVFPETTHVYGWTRCVEAGRPSDLELEFFVDPGVPTVFFAQSFCAKQDVAHALAERHGGLAIDCHREVNDSILAKIEAFIRLS